MKVELFKLLKPFMGRTKNTTKKMKGALFGRPSSFKGTNQNLKIPKPEPPSDSVHNTHRPDRAHRRATKKRESIKFRTVICFTGINHLVSFKTFLSFLKRKKMTYPIRITGKELLQFESMYLFNDEIEALQRHFSSGSSHPQMGMNDYAPIINVHLSFTNQRIRVHIKRIVDIAPPGGAHIDVEYRDWPDHTGFIGFDFEAHLKTILTDMNNNIKFPKYTRTYNDRTL